ncbi:hypothetical protein SAMN04487770_12055 [Butyrivibrio sp. ob235]|uniref:CPBP family intramembrane glutamic endopeptidase n=1 Tax=Butyrivibrio sp. ob235 TaxID=1761780 RepID=UPI0008BC0AE9|nr:CPBP family intramembrane glutamic endopeptidase [Butyrivibrio sp. ob235]SEL90379.1 hypothetical protein SAMN04487770_12055 [Butyrivibrio sp. ob235]
MKGENVMNTKGSKGKAVLVALGLMLLFLAIQAVVGLVASIIAPIMNPEAATDAAAITAYVMSVMPVVQFIAEIVCILVFGIWYYRSYVKKAKELRTYESGFKKIASLKDIGFILSLTFAAYFLAAVIGWLVTVLIPGSGDLFSSLIGAITDGNKTIGMLTVMLLGPVAEELCFRGVILQKSKKAFGIVGCTVLSAVMFGLMHMNPVQSLYAIPIGAALAFTAYKYESIVPAMIGHIVNNSFSMILSNLVKEDLNQILALVLFAAFAVLSVVIYRSIPKVEKFDESDKLSA